MSTQQFPFKPATSGTNLLLRKEEFPATAESHRVACARSNSAMAGFLIFLDRRRKAGRERYWSVIGRGLAQERDSVLHHLVGPGQSFLTFSQDGCYTVPCLNREVQPIARNPVIQAACTFWSHGPQSSTHMLAREHRWPVDNQGLKHLSAGLSESTSGPIHSSATSVFRPMLPPCLGPTGQCCTRVGPVIFFCRGR